MQRGKAQGNEVLGVKSGQVISWLFLKRPLQSRVCFDDGCDDQGEDTGVISKKCAEHGVFSRLRMESSLVCGA